MSDYQTVRETGVAARQLFQLWTGLLLGAGGAPFAVEVDWGGSAHHPVGHLMVRRTSSNPDTLVATEFDFVRPGRYRGLRAVCFQALGLKLAGKIGLDTEGLCPDPGAELTAAGLCRMVARRLPAHEQASRFAASTAHLLVLLHTELLRADRDFRRLNQTAAPLLRLDRVWAGVDRRLDLLARVVADCVEELILNQAFERTPDLSLDDVALAAEGLRRLVEHPDQFMTGSGLPRWPYLRFIHQDGEIVRIEVRDVLDEEDEDRGWVTDQRSFFAIVEADQEVIVALDFQRRYPALPYEAARELARAQIQRQAGATSTFFYHAKRAIEPLLRERLGAYVRQTILPTGVMTLGKYLQYLRGPGRERLGERTNPFLQGMSEFVRVRNDADHGEYYDPSPKLMERAWKFLNQPDGALAIILSLPIAPRV